MGNATARLALDAGADVVVMDHAPCDLADVTAIRLNLADKARKLGIPVWRFE